MTLFKNHALISTNVKGPPTLIKIAGSEIQDIYVYAGPCHSGLVTFSYNGILRLIMKYDGEIGVDVMEEYIEIYREVWDQYLALASAT
jgi:hypothetical protein